MSAPITNVPASPGGLQQAQWTQRLVKRTEFLLSPIGGTQPVSGIVQPITVYLANAQHVLFQSRMHVPLLARFRQPGSNQDTLIMFLDPNMDHMVKSAVSLGSVLLSDLSYPQQNSGTGTAYTSGQVIGALEGQRNTDQLPTQTGLSANNTSISANGEGGFLNIVSCSLPFEVRSVAKPVVNGINFPQQMVAAEAGVQSVAWFTPTSTAFAAGGAIAAAAGLFQSITVFNPTASSFTITTAPYNGINGVQADNPSFTVPANTAFSIPLESEAIWATFTAAGQEVIAWQQVVLQMAYGVNG